MAQRLYQWAIEDQHANHFVATRVSKCFSEDYLLKLPANFDNHYWPRVPGTKNWRYLFCRQVSALLGWSEVRKEGHPLGIPAFVYTFIRNKHWPKSEDERGSEEGSERSAQSATTYRVWQNQQGLEPTTRSRTIRSQRRHARLRAQPISRREPRQFASTNPYTIAGGDADRISPRADNPNPGPSGRSCRPNPRV